MRTLLIALFLSLTIAQMPACVTYNPGTQTYVVDSYGAWELGSEGYSQEYQRKKINPKADNDSFSFISRCSDKPKIVKQPRPIDWDESY